MQITIDHLFRAFKLAVKYWPANDDYRKQVNSFAVVTMMEQLNSDNLGQYPEKKDTNYFYSRKWEELLFNPTEFVMQTPYLAVYEPDGNGTIQNPFDPSYSKTEYSLWIWILDAFKEISYDPSSPDTVEDFLSIEELYLEAERKLKILFYFLSTEIIFGSYQGESNVYTAGMIAEMIQVQGGTWELDEHATLRFREILREMNDEITFDRWSGGVKDMHGIRTSIEFKAFCDPAPVFNYQLDGNQHVVPDNNDFENIDLIPDALIDFALGNLSDFSDGAILEDF
jgi:hypothetical protein